MGGDRERTFNSADEPTWWQQALQDAADRIAFLEAELAAIRDVAYRGVGAPADALEAVQVRAVRAIGRDA